MTTLIFKNKKLKEILRIREQATTFRATYTEAVKAYEKDTGKEYDYNTNLVKYYEHNTPTLWLVKDDGIYLMTSAKLENIPSDKGHICYAEGYEPDVPGCWEKCCVAVGGDDFVESFKFNNQLKMGIKSGAEIYIQITANSYSIQLVRH